MVRKMIELVLFGLGFACGMTTLMVIAVLFGEGK